MALRRLRIEVDDEGIVLSGGQDEIFDVLFDDVRTWGFTPLRADRVGLRWRVRWPEALTPYLQGTTRMTVRTHADHVVVFDEEVSFGTGEGRLKVADKDGRPLSMTKYGRLNRAFDSLDEDVKAHYLDQVEDVLAVIRDECGLPGFIAWGTLLGAVRTGHLIGHDVDADLAWYSDHDAPVDVIRESFGIERALRAKGWTVRRENGAFLALFLQQADGSSRNMDVFGCWRTDDWLYLVHDARSRLPRSTVLPLGSVELEGRSFPAPADPPALLTACYGESWRVPDPSFAFEPDPDRGRRIEGWLGGLRMRRDRWGLVHRESKPRSRPSRFARWVEAREDGRGATLLDLGCGDAADVQWFAREGRRVVGVEQVSAVVTLARRRMQRAGLDSVELRCLNLLDLRSTLVLGAEMAAEPAPTLYARQLLCELDDPGRRDLWRLARMSLRDGGALFLEVHTGRCQLGNGPTTIRCRGIKVEQVRRAAEAHGFTVVTEEPLVEPDRPALHRFELRLAAAAGGTATG